MSGAHLMASEKQSPGQLQQGRSGYRGGSRAVARGVTKQGKRRGGGWSESPGSNHRTKRQAKNNALT
ncbi:hypothetical protein MHYP_G00040750 [Metynnis hypsauchen]